MAAIGSAWYVRAEVARTLDAALFESAQRLLELTSHELSEHKVPLDEMTLSRVSSSLPSDPIIEDDDLMYQVVNSRGHVLMRSADAPAQVMSVPSADGFFDTADLRVYTLQHPTLPVRIHIGAPLAHRRQMQLAATLWGMLPLLGLLPLVAWIIRQVSRRELAPVRDLAQQIRERTEHDLRPVVLRPLAQELASVAESTNYLMQRLGEALDAERALAANAAHELRTPLATVRLRLQNVLSQPLADAAREEVRNAVGALDQLSRRTEKLLQLSRGGGGRGHGA
ncbi:sensor histidine kinase N-terminal domain-containing protein [Polaromonas sp. P1-6]|nr:sensor histidine kinase N-terminal domain-containing protein [Polaromonas sp. P1-6]